MTCKECKEPLKEIGFNRRYCVRLCNNHKCSLCAQQQGIREWSEEEGEAYMQRRKARFFMGAIGRGKKEVTPERAIQNEHHRARPSYQPWLEGKKERYRKLRDLGYSCKEAMANSSKKRMREIMEGVMA